MRCRVPHRVSLSPVSVPDVPNSVGADTISQRPSRPRYALGNGDRMAGFSLQAASDVAVRQDEGTTVVLRDEQDEAITYPGDDGKPVEVTALVAGALSHTYRKANDAQRAKWFKRGTAKPTIERIDAQNAEVIAGCVLSWTLRDGDKPIACTKDNVLKVFEVAPWIRVQIEAAMADPARFLR